MGDVDFREVCPVLGHIVANHWTRNGKWLDLWSCWKWPHRYFGVCRFFPPLPPGHHFSSLTYPPCIRLDFLGTHPHSETGSLNVYVSMNILPSCWAVPRSCWGRSRTMCRGSLCHSSWTMAEKCPLPCYYRSLNLPILTICTHCAAILGWMLNGGECDTQQPLGFEQEESGWGRAWPGWPPSF